MNKKWYFIPAILIYTSQTCASEPYHLVKASLNGGGEIAMKYHEITGQTWYFNQYQWYPIKDLTPIPESVYQVISKSSQEKIGHWIPLRIDKKSGKSWRANTRNGVSSWIEIKTLKTPSVKKPAKTIRDEDVPKTMQKILTPFGERLVPKL